MRVGAMIGIVMAVTSLLSATASAAAPDEVDPAVVVELLDEATALLEQEMTLAPLSNAERFGDDPDFEANQRQFRQAQQDGTLVRTQLENAGVALSDDVRATLGHPDDDGSGERNPRPPGPDVYSAALVDVQILADEYAAATPSTTLDDRAAGSKVRVLAVVGAGAIVAAGALMIARRRRSHRERELQSAREDAMTDPLTGLSNRRRLDHDADGLADSVMDDVAVMMIDIDHFKSFNDRYGHPVGDDVLRRVGAVLERAVRAQDVVYRYGGEEFCVVLAGTGLDLADDVAQRVHAALAADSLHEEYGVTVSIGVADGTTSAIDEAITRADRALYDAKHAGRNRTALTAS